MRLHRSRFCPCDFQHLAGFLLARRLLPAAISIAFTVAFSLVTTAALVTTTLATENTADSAARALVQVTPNGGIGASTFGGSQLRIANTSANGHRIVSLRMDLTTALLPDLVFDPDGLAGDVTAKCLTPDVGAASTGFVEPADPCRSPFSSPHDDGYDVLEIAFNDFGPGEEFRFSVDVDPTSIRGAPGTANAGAVSGLELSGATITVTFDEEEREDERGIDDRETGDQETLDAQLFRAGTSLGGSAALVEANAPPAPSIEGLGLVSPTVVANAAQTVRVITEPGTDLRLVQVEGDLDLNDASGFDLDPFEANTAVAVTEYAAKANGAGVADVPVTLTRETGRAGINLFQAVALHEDGSGRNGAVSNTLIAVLDGDCTGNLDCSDGNPCTDDICDGIKCRNPPSDGASCDDGLFCTSDDTCSAGVCSGFDACPPGQECNRGKNLCEAPAIRFRKGVLTGPDLHFPTSLQFGPDGRLYVAEQFGRIFSCNVIRLAPGHYQADDPEMIDGIAELPNHNDDGSPAPEIIGRLLTGILVTGTADAPVIYASSSDPRIGGGNTGNDSGLDTNSGVLSKLTLKDGDWVRHDLVRGLPRSEENHHGNGLLFDEASGLLLLAQGGNTNRGAPSNNFAGLPETALSAAILSIDVAAIGGSTYDLPTLDDEDRPGSIDSGDPFGGNDAKNQALLDPEGPVQVYAPGFRNPYDLVRTEAGHLYTVDNGANAGWGNDPVGAGTAACSNEINEPGRSQADVLQRVSGPGYYGGHPNPTRGNRSNTFNESNPQTPIPVADPRQCTWNAASAPGALATFESSTNGFAEYTATNFAGQMQGDLVLASFDNSIRRIGLDESGGASTGDETLFANVGTRPLDVVAQGDGEVFPGTIWVAVHGDGEIVVYEPEDSMFCDGEYFELLDEDGDGFDNADEIDNGTDPCSPGDFPADTDGDFVSDRNDDDDDNDGFSDRVDPFAVDAANGKTRRIPFVFTWDNDTTQRGGILDLGFTGLMTDGVTDYRDHFDADRMTVGGAAGVLTVDAVRPGDALGAANDQDYAFQVGFDGRRETGVFTVHADIVGPFLGLAPEDFQSMGIFVGDGSQDNYAKVVTAASGGSGGVQALVEVSGSVLHDATAALMLPGPARVDLYLTVDPNAGTVQAAFAADGAAIERLGTPMAVPPAWFDEGDFALAAGIISTSRGPGDEFAAAWGKFEVFGGPAACTTNSDCDDANACSDDVCELGRCVHRAAADNKRCDDGLSCTRQDRCQAGVCTGVEQCPAQKSCAFPEGICAAPSGDPDNDGLSGDDDPCPSEPRNQCAGPIAFETTQGKSLRLNAGVSKAECAGPKIDCNGDAWLADFGYNRATAASTCNLEGGGAACVIEGIADLFGCDNDQTQALFRCDHFDNPLGKDLAYTFAVPNGAYVVNLFFANTFSGSADAGDRLFDIRIQDALAYKDFDQVLASGGSAVAVVRSSTTVVEDGELSIEFVHLERQNPAIKAIEVLTYLPPTTTTSSTSTTTLPAECGSLSLCPNCNGNCNCLGGIEPADPICALLRDRGEFDLDPCAEGMGDFRASASLKLSFGNARPLRDGSGFRVPLRLRGRHAGSVAALGLELFTASRISGLRLVGRLRRAGFQTTIESGDQYRWSMLVQGPEATDEIQTIGRGRLARLTLRGTDATRYLCRVEYGSAAGLPLKAKTR